MSEQIELIRKSQTVREQKLPDFFVNSGIAEKTDINPPKVTCRLLFIT